MLEAQYPSGATNPLQPTVPRHPLPRWPSLVLTAGYTSFLAITMGSAFFLLLLLFFPGASRGEGPTQQETENSREEALALGRQIYRQGVLANGEPVEATVMGDVEVLGTQFTCLNCHGRSGMGGVEGKTFTLAINAGALFSPRRNIYLTRSAYDDKTLDVAIRQGETPDGTPLSLEMPVYNLPDREMTALTAYLKTLSHQFSPGLTDEAIHIATVVSDQADPAAKQAMLAVMHSFFRDKNAQTRNEKKRAARGPFYQHYRIKAYRDWILHVWELKGPPEEWAAQLEHHYSQQPVFAMLGGLVHEPWESIHTFCEKNEIPSLLPNTDRPGGIGKHDFYTLYFSEGMYLEARVMAADMGELQKTARVLQVFRSGQESAFGARSLTEAATKLKGVDVTEWALDRDASLSRAELREKITSAGADTLVLWLSRQDLEKLQLQGTERLVAGHTYLSSSLLGGIFSSLPPSLGTGVKLAHPFILPEKQEVVFKRVRNWLEDKKIPINNPRILGQTYYACMTLTEGFMHIKRHFYRDYLMDALDHANAKSIYCVNYPRLSFGPEQRYLAKGAYIIDAPGATPLPAQAIWRVPHL